MVGARAVEWSGVGPCGCPGNLFHISVSACYLVACIAGPFALPALPLEFLLSQQDVLGQT